MRIVAMKNIHYLQKNYKKKQRLQQQSSGPSSQNDFNLGTYSTNNLDECQKIPIMEMIMMQTSSISTTNNEN